MIMRAMAILAALAAMPAKARPNEIFQLFSYRLVDPVQFREGYRHHLRWHERNNDRLVWYAWTVQSGARRGLFIDGTAGATLSDLDARPDLLEDGADFARTAGPFSEPVDIEAWQLWKSPSTATPLEDQRPSRTLDVFLIRVAPGKAAAFERAVARLVPVRERQGQLTWYRKLRGGATASYMLVGARDRWSDIDLIGTSLEQLFLLNYRQGEEHSRSILKHVSDVSVETWTYEPRLSLFPGTPLAP